MSPERDAPAALSDGVLDDEEPAPLGAAPTLPADRVARSRPAHGRVERRRERRSANGSAAAAPEVASPWDGDSGVVYVFEPHTGAVPPLRPYLRSLRHRRRFMVELAKADIRGSRSSTMLGSIWGLLDPLFQAAIYLFLFTVITRGRGRPIEFLPVMLGGIFLFRLTASALNDGGRSIRSSSDLMLTSTFPRALLPLAAVYKGLLNFIPTVFVFTIVYAFFGEPLHESMLLLPPLFALQVVTNIGIALLVSTIAVFVKDMQNALTYVTRILLFTTPVIYPVWLLTPELRTVLSFQPLFPLFATYQSVIASRPIDPTLIVLAACWALGLLVVGGWLFLRNENAMASRL